MPEKLFSGCLGLYLDKYLQGYPKMEVLYATQILEQLWGENNFRHLWNPIKLMDRRLFLELHIVDVKPTRFPLDLFGAEII